MSFLASYKPRYANIAAIVLICLAAVLVYSNTFHTTFHFDDEESIIRNVAIRHLFDFKTIWDFWPTRFVTYISFALNYRLGQLDVFGYHVFNFMIHLGAALFAWWLALLTFSTPALKNDRIKGHAPLIALFTGLIFAVHPLQTQAVTYVVQRATALAALFYLASLCLYAKSRISGKGGAYYAGSLIAAVCATFSKETAITLPFAILLYEFTFLKTEDKKGWKYLIPFLALIFAIPLTAFITKFFNFQEMRKITEEPPFATSPQYLFTQFRVLITYVRLLFFPLNQNTDYDIPIIKSFFTFPALSGFLLLSAIFIIALSLFKRNRLISFCILWPLLTLIPESSVFPIRDLIFEHRLYLPMFGYALLVSSGAYYLFGRKNIKLMAGILIAVTVIYSALAYHRNFVWKDELTLWSDVIKKSPQKAGAYNSRGNAYAALGDIARAIADYDRSIQLNPMYVDVYNNRGNAYAHKGDFKSAIADYDKVLQLNPFHVGGLYNRGVAYFKNGDLDKAIADFTGALQSNPRLAEAYQNRGSAYMQKGEVDLAISDFNNSARFSPYFGGAHASLGTAYTRKNELDKAIAEFGEAIRLEPGNASYCNDRGAVYGVKGALNWAMDDFNKAISIDPRYAAAYCNRGNIHMSKGNIDRAIIDFSKALEADRLYFKARSDRAVAYFLKKEYDKAWEDIRELEGLGMKLNPKFIEELKKASGE